MADKAIAIEWGEAPPRKRAESKWERVLGEFIMNPGVEGRVPDSYTRASSSSLVYSINAMIGLKFPEGTKKGDFQAKRAPFGNNGRWGVWVKYVGRSKKR